ncbi:MAG: YkgJ family cysteine cluster protein [Alphaproteobacteria bacterium]|nr:YkgJ family cysteine cluster protein [Alphaproteobacteria bacterium]
MDQELWNVARAVESGATTIRAVVEATALSHLKVERALRSLEKQKWLIRDNAGFRPRQASTRPDRQCGSCNLCCDILEVTAVDKPIHQLCRHWEPGKGCVIYDQRPQMCRSFACAWWQGHFDEDWFPVKAGLVVHFSAGAVNIHVVPSAPDRWREEPWFSTLCGISLKGTRPGLPPYATLVVSGNAKFLLLGRTVVPDPTPFGTSFVPLSPETFHYWKARSEEHARRLNERAAEMQRIQQEFGFCGIPEEDDPHPPYRPALMRVSGLQEREPPSRR